MKKQLLHTPEGVKDTYNRECEEKLLIENRIHAVFKSFGYSDIETPSFEFFDVFNKERGSVSSNHMYKFFDRDNNTMVLRPDMTPAIARCAAKYFDGVLNPIRLCYMSNAFINNTSYQGRLKETTVGGCELIGESSVTADAEMIALLIEAILSSGLSEFQVEIGHVGFFKGLAKEAGLDENATKELKTILRNKNLFSIKDLLTSENISAKYNDIFYKLPELFGDVEILKEAENLASNKESLSALNHLKKVYELLKVYGFEKYVTFDLGVLSELDYYTGVIFKAYTFDVGEPIANGGRYDSLVAQFGSDRPSIGFGITIDLLHLALMRQKVEIPVGNKGKLIVYNDSTVECAIKLAAYLRSSGIAATLSNSAYGEDNFDEIIIADEKALERYGIK